MDIEEKVFATIANVMEVPAASVDKNSSTETIEGWDSIRHMNLMLALQQEFNVEIELEDMVEMQNAEIICKVIREAIG